MKIFIFVTCKLAMAHWYLWNAAAIGMLRDILRCPCLQAEVLAKAPGSGEELSEPDSPVKPQAANKKGKKGAQPAKVRSGYVCGAEAWGVT